jgi:hypothetical protein
LELLYEALCAQSLMAEKLIDELKLIMPPRDGSLTRLFMRNGDCINRLRSALDRIDRAKAKEEK